MQLVQRDRLWLLQMKWRIREKTLTFGRCLCLGVGRVPLAVIRHCNSGVSCSFAFFIYSCGSAAVEKGKTTGFDPTWAGRSHGQGLNQRGDEARAIGPGRHGMGASLFASGLIGVAMQRRPTVRIDFGGERFFFKSLSL